jgi:hypothetical protein
MNAQNFKSLHLPPLVLGMGAVLVSGIAIASLALSGPGFSSDLAPAAVSEAAAVPASTARAGRAYRCAECGVIVSVREINAFGEPAEIDAPNRIAAGAGGGIGATSPRNFEITIRMQDGTVRVIQDAKPAQWRRGEPLTVIAGVD